MHVFVIRVRLLTLLTLGVLAGSSHLAAAAGVVGTGTAASCTEAALDVALAGGGLVTFNCGAAAVTISTTSVKTIAVDTTIDGGGLITLDGGGLVSDLIDVLVGITLTVSNLTLVDANPNPGEAEIGNTGTVIATNCTFANNNQGFGIFNERVLRATDCTFSGLAQAIIDIGGMETVANCTFSHNGEGIRTNGTVVAVNSTFSGNSANGILNTSGVVTVTNCTVTGSSSGPGIAGGAGATLTNTIVAGNPGGNCTGTTLDGGHNLEDGTSCGFTANSLSNTPADFDPAGLANNGGPTETIALLPASAAVDGGDDTVCSAPPVNGLDQRGFARPGTGHTHCSIGAFEFYLTPPPTSTPTATATETGTPIPAATATPVATSTPALPPLIKLQCMNGGWRNFIVPRQFKNQGDCIRFVNTGK